MKPVIIGAGLAGLTAALSLAPVPVVVLSAGRLGEQCSSGWAQGGLAAAMGIDDAPHFHAEDTIKAGAGLCDAGIARLVTEGSASVVKKLTALGVAFDKNAEGELQFGLEAAHTRRRIVHTGGDGAGRAIMQALVAAVRASPSIEILEDARAADILTGDGGVEGLAIVRNGRSFVLPADHVVLATGGAGALWRHTTNPLASWGSGLALAVRAGAVLIDLEFMQFHPTAIDINRDPMPLASEALRGEGAVLVDEDGERFMKHYPRAELEPRDVVARAIWAHKAKGHFIFLDAREAIGAHFARRFPIINAACLAAGIDPAKAPIPVSPAAHYHMGGVKVDDAGHSAVEGLWACGEVAATGLHGANRLASNSLLEAAYFGARVGEGIKNNRLRKIRTPGSPSLQPECPGDAPRIRAIMSAHAGVLRDEKGLEQAVAELAPLAGSGDMGLVALMVVTAALRREESRGSHARTDFPQTDALAYRQTLGWQEVMPAASLSASPSSAAMSGI